MAIALTDEMATALDNALAQRSPCLGATASAEGVPDVSYRGSMMVFDDQHLAFWERAKGETLANLVENPNIVVFYRNPETRQSWRFYGKAKVLKDGPVRSEIMGRVNQLELAQDAERTGYGILIRVDRVRARNDTVMVRDPDRGG
jgi:hypothetical protein